MSDHEARDTAALEAYVEAYYAGARPDLDDFLLAHPDCGPRLREKIEDFLFAADHLSRAKPAEDGSPAGAGATTGGACIRAGAVLGDFEIIREIGRGGMGVVFEAEQRSLGRRVALKVLPAHLSLSEDSVKKFHREARAGGRQSHPGIVAVYSMGSVEGVHYIAAELVKGGRSLADRLDEERQQAALPVGYFRQAAAFIADAADALQHAHDSGVIHRDVKPSNILIDPEGRPKITDFGLAKVEDALALSRTGDFSGTPYYMSPEQAGRARAPVDHRTDIFSLGVTLYEMITLSLPFDGETAHAVLKKIVLDDPPDPRRVNPRVPRDLAVIGLKAMEKKPEYRYASMAALAADLRRFVNGETILARPAGPAARLVKRVRRYPVLSAAVAIAAAALLALVTLLPIAYFGAVKDRRQAEGSGLLAASRAELQNDPALALLLALEGSARSPGLQANNAVLEALKVCHERCVIHAPGVLDAAASPCGKKIALAMADGTLVIRLVGGAAEKRTIAAHAGAVRSVEYSRDGAMIITASDDGTARILDAESGEEIAPPVQHAGTVLDASFSPDGRTIVTASCDMTALVRDTAGALPPVRLIGFGWTVTSAKFSEDGELVVAGSEDETARVFDARTGAELVRLPEHGNFVNAAVFHCGGAKRQVLTACEDGDLSIWPVDDPLHPAAVLRLDSAVKDVACSPDGRLAAAARADGSVAVLDVAAGSAVLELKGHRAAATRVAFARAADILATASDDGTARVWSLTPFVRRLGPEDGWETVAVSPCGGKAVQVCRDSRTLSVVDIASGRRIRLERSAQGAAPPSETGLIAVGGAGRYRIDLIPVATRLFRFVDSASGRVLPESINVDQNEFKHLAFGRGGTLLAAGMCNNMIKTWDLASGDLIHLAHHDGDLPVVRIDSTGRRMAAVMSDFTVRLVDLDSGAEQIWRLHEEDSRISITCLAFSPDGSSIAAGCGDGTVRVRRLGPAAQEMDLPGQSAEISDLVFSNDGEKLAAGTVSGVVAVWDLTGDGPPVRHQAGSRVNMVRFDPDGRRTVSAHDDGTALVRSGKDAGVRAMRLDGGGDALCLAEFSPVGDAVLTLSRAGTAMLWNTADGELQATLTHDRRDGPAKLGAFDPSGLFVVTATEAGALCIWPARPVEYAAAHKPRELTAHERSLYLPDAGGETGHPRAELPTVAVPAPGPANGAGCRPRQPEPRFGSTVAEATAQSLPIRSIDPFMFIGGREEGDGRINALMLFDPTGEPPIHELYVYDSSTVMYLAASPDGRRLGFIGADESAHELLMAQEIDGGSISDPAPICRLSSPSLSHLAWHPRGECLYFHAADGGSLCGTNSIYRIPFHDGEPGEAVRFLSSAGAAFSAPQVSADDGRMCFCHFRKHSEAYYLELWTVQLSEDGAAAFNPQRHTSDDRAEGFACFAHRGESLIRLSNRSLEPSRVDVMPLDGPDGWTIFNELPLEPGWCRVRTFFDVAPSGLLALTLDIEKQGTCIRIIDPETGRGRTFTPDDLPEGWQSLAWPCFLPPPPTPPRTAPSAPR